MATLRRGLGIFLLTASHLTPACLVVAAPVDVTGIKSKVQAFGQLQPVVEAVVRFSGRGANASTPFLAAFDDVFAQETNFLSVDDIRVEAVSFSPCDGDKCGLPICEEGGGGGGSAAPHAADPAPPPSPPPPRRALRGMNPVRAGAKCIQTVDLSVQVRRNTTLTRDQLASLRSALVSDRLVRRLRSDGVEVDRAALVHFAETDVNAQLAPPTAAPEGATGKDTVTFKLMLVGPAASVSNSELTRTLHSIILSNLTSGPIDYVTAANTRILKVAVTPSSMVMPSSAPAARPPEAWPGGGGAALAPPSQGRRQRRRLAQMLVGAIPASVVPDAGAGDGDSHTQVPDLPPPQVRAAPVDGSAASGSAPAPRPPTPGGGPEPLPAVDFTFQVDRLPRAGSEAVYTQLSHAIVTNALTNAMTSAGWNINSVTDALNAGSKVGWFAVNGKPFGETGAGGPPNFLAGVRGGRARETEPGVIAAAALVPALLAVGLAAAGWVAYTRRSPGGGAPGGGKGVPTVGLAAAVAAAARSSSGAPSAAALLGINPDADATSTGTGGGGGLAAASGKDASTHGGGAGNGGCGYTALAERDWQLDPSSLRILTRPDGSEWELGAGASGRVYKALLGGAQEVAVKVFSERLPALVDGGSGGGEPGKKGGRDGGAAAASGARARPARTRPAWLARLVRTRLPRDDDTAGERGPADEPAGTAVSDPAKRTSNKGAALGAAATSRSDPTSTAPSAKAAGGDLGPSQAGAALKSRPADGAATTQKRRVPLLEELAREVLLLRACHDRNIVSFVGASIQAGHAVLVTEYMPGGDLHAAIAEDAATDRGRFTWRRRLGPTGKPIPRTGVNRQTALDIARGLHFLHARRIVHLDLKSPNILLGRAGEAKIADVGLSKVLRDRFVSTMHAVGTYNWAAPEVLMGQPTSEAADIYSFGVLLWELSVREAPTGRHLRRVEVPEEAPASVVALMDRCLSPDPTTRPTALELVHFFVDLGRSGSGSGATAGVDAVPTAVVGGVGEEAAPGADGGGGGGVAHWLGKRLSGRKSSGGVAATAGPVAAPVVPASGFGGAGGGGGGAPPPAAPVGVPASGFDGGGGRVQASPFGGDAEAPPPPPPPPRPVSRPGVSGPPPKAGEP